MQYSPLVYAYQVTQMHCKLHSRSHAANYTHHPMHQTNIMNKQTQLVHTFPPFWNGKSDQAYTQYATYHTLKRREVKKMHVTLIVLQKKNAKQYWRNTKVNTCKNQQNECIEKSREVQIENISPMQYIAWSPISLHDVGGHKGLHNVLTK